MNCLEPISKIDFEGIFKYLAIMQDGFSAPTRGILSKKASATGWLKTQKISRRYF
jgi:hypothetical protein